MKLFNLVRLYVCFFFSLSGIVTHAAVLTKWATGSLGTDVFAGVTYGNGVFALVGYNSEIWTSKTGKTWTEGPGFSGVDIDFQSDTFANGVFVSVGTIETSGYDPFGVFTSTDGKSWTETSEDYNGPHDSVSYCGNEFVSMGSDGYYWISTDGYSWADENNYGMSGMLFTAVAYDPNDAFFAAIDGGTMWSGPGIASFGVQPVHTNVKPRTVTDYTFYYAITFPDDLNGITFGNNLLVTVGANGLIATSPDGTNWTTQTSGTANNLNAVTYGGGYFMAVGDNGTILSSPDGVNWTGMASGTSNIYYAVTYGNGTFVAVGADGTVSICDEVDDTAKPTVEITSPKSGQKLTSQQLTITGKANDKYGIAQVYYSLNGSDWQEAGSSDSGSTWSANVTLIPGTNLVEAAAVNLGDIAAYTKPVHFQYVVYTPMTVQTNGPGTLAPNYNGKSLEIGKEYSMTAKPAKNYEFTGWTGDTNSAGATLKFFAQPGLAYTANFAPK
jgi:hypothetical protein